jgi:cation diffusion facilitator CzcD-associated flavoprotein CzcO
MARCAIVGGGLAGFVAYVTLRLELEPGEITVFGEQDDPLGAWLPRAHAIRQQRMRSESDGHCFPRSFPGLAPREAVRRRSPAPVVRSVCNRYRPTLAEFVDHVERLRERCGWDESFRRARVSRVRAVDGGFEVDGALFRHVLLAPGHPGLAVPDELAGDPRVVHAYAPHEYAARVAVVGAGMAAATEWVNALAAGAEVVSVRRREPLRMPLNVPRSLFTKRGLAAFHASSPAVRAERLEQLGVPSYPPGRDWDEPLEHAAGEGRFRVERGHGDSAHARKAQALSDVVDGVAQVICATGFKRGFEHDPLLAQLVADHKLETHDCWLALAPDSTVPALTDSTRTLALAGAPAQWAYPGADTLMGMKYAARRFARRVQR